MHLQRKCVLVTGSAVRVGRVIAIRLARQGADIAVHYNRSEAQAKTTAEEICGMGVRAFPVQGDLSRADEVEAIVGAVEKELGSIDVLVNSASVYHRKPFMQLTEADWDQNLDVNVKAPFLLARLIGPGMKERGRGKILNIVDWAAERPYKEYMPYCSSKAALVNLTKSLALALAPEVQVNGIAPGPVMLPEDFSDEEVEIVEKAVPLKRLGSPEDIASAAQFLIEGTDYMTGSIITVDGGRLIA